MHGAAPSNLKPCSTWVVEPLRRLVAAASICSQAVPRAARAGRAELLRASGVGLLIKPEEEK